MRQESTLKSRLRRVSGPITPEIVAEDTVRLLYRHGVGGLVVSAAAATCMALVAMKQTHSALVWWWWSLMAFVLLCRSLDQVLYRSRSAVNSVRRFSFGLVVTTCLWASFSLVFMPVLDETGRAFAAIVLSALVGGGATTLAPSKPLAFTFAAGLLLPPAVQFFRLPGLESTFLGTLSCVFFAVMVASTRVTHDSLMSSVKLSRTNQNLLAGMKLEQARTAAANRELLESRAELENRVHQRTAELSSLNQQLRLEIEIRTHAEQELRQAVAAKQVLLQEVHHRVKNNLQIISSLLSLQADSLPASVSGLLVDCQRRVRSISLVHEQLYGRHDPGELDFSMYVRSLASDLRDTYDRNSGRVELHFELDPVVLLPLNEAIPCGLILNELLTNSLKYAFPESKGGRITIRVRALEEDRQIIMHVADNGTGMPPGFDWQNASSLGLRLVQVLTGQLNGSVTYDGTSGAAFTVTFRKSGVPLRVASAGV